MTRWLRDWGPALLVAGLIFAVSARPTVPMPAVVGIDKLAHLAAYLVLGTSLAWGGARRGLPRTATALLGVAYGASDELHQMFVPGRYPDAIDWLADAAGAILGVALFYPFFARRLALRSRTP